MRPRPVRRPEATRARILQAKKRVDGAAVFEAQGCGSCHTLAAAGSTGETGPDLDGALADRDPGYIEESIVDPAAVVAEGYLAEHHADDLRRPAAGGARRPGSVSD